MSNFLEVPTYLIMAFSMVLDAPLEKASRVSGPQISKISIEDVAPGNRAPFRIGEGEWLRIVKSAGPQSDVLKIYADRIFVTSTGRHYVVDEATRADLASLSSNPRIVMQVMTASITSLKSCLEKKLDGAPSRTSLLIGHYFGCDTAARYANTLEHAPDAAASVALPQLRLDTMAKTKLSEIDARLAHTLAAAAREQTPHKPAAIVATHSGQPRYGAAGLKGAITTGERNETPLVATSE